MAPTSASYRVRILPDAHQLDVQLRLEGLPAPVRLVVPTWVPGAYGFMKYGRDLFEVKARDPKSGAEVPVEREGWSGFVVRSPGDALEVSYRAGAADSAFADLAGLVGHDQALLLGARYLCAPLHAGPCRVRYELPAGWKLHHPAGARRIDDGTFEYPSYQALLDTPLVAGHFDLRSRRAHGADFHHLFLDQAVGFDTEVDSFVDAVMKVAEECRSVFGSYPFESYTFVYSFSPAARWGLEHAHATTVGLGENALIEPRDRARGVRVCAHELFHAWNVCRLKPAALVSPDLTAGSFPEELWVSEGFTRYYEFLLCARAGAIAPEVFWSNIVNYYRYLTARPAYERVSAVDASRATFLNHNRFVGSVNSAIDYYDKGMLVAFDLDAALRTAGDSLDGRFRAFYQRFLQTGFSQQDLREVFGELVEREAERPGGLSVLERLASLGFRVTQAPVKYLGLILVENAGPQVIDVLDTSPAGRSGLMPGDEILRANGFSYSFKALQWLIAHAREVRLEVRRGHRYLDLAIPPAERADIKSLTWEGTAAQAEILHAWHGFRPARGQEIPLDSYENFHGVQTIL